MLLTGFMLVMVSCSPTRYVGKDEYLLNKVKVRVEAKGVNFSELKKTVRQRPNTRILGVARFHLGLYNLSGKNENKRFNKWLRSIGEAPVIYSPFLTDRSVTQLKLYLNNKGFYKAEVTDSVWFKKKKAHVVYRIYPGPLTRVKDFTFREDSSFRAGGLPESFPLVQLVLRDTNHTLLHQEMPMDIEILEDDFYNTNNDNIEYCNIPIVGTVAAGEPILATENIDGYFPVPTEYISGTENFMLKIKGNSMTNAGIFNGDLVLVKQQNTAENNDIVIAMIDDSATCKRYFKEKEYIRLQPENDSYEPIYVKDCTILGLVKGLFRSFK